MADQENCVRVTRAATKRAAAMAPLKDQPVLKKRVVLGELPNLSNVVVSVNKGSGGLTQKQKIKPKPKAKKSIIVKKDEASKGDIDGTSDDPQMCGPYASDIYEYLHKLEVSSSALAISSRSARYIYLSIVHLTCIKRGI